MVELFADTNFENLRVRLLDSLEERNLFAKGIMFNFLCETGGVFPSECLLFLLLILVTTRLHRACKLPSVGRLVPW